MFIVLVMCVLCKILVFVLMIADAIKPTRKKEKMEKEHSRDFYLRSFVLFNMNSALYA